MVNVYVGRSMTKYGKELHPLYGNCDKFGPGDSCQECSDVSDRIRGYTIGKFMRKMSCEVLGVDHD
mgnify:CR=1 FL=1